MCRQPRGRQHKRSWPATSLDYDKRMHQITDLEIHYTLCPCTHAPQSTHSGHASSHVSTIHTGVSSRPHPHSHTHTHLCTYCHTFTFTFTKPSRVHSVPMRAFHILTGSAAPTFSLSQVTPTHAGTHVTHPLSRSCTPRKGRPMSAPRPGPSGLRQGRRGAATSQGVSHGLQGAGWGARCAVRVNGCWVSRIVPCPHGARWRPQTPATYRAQLGPHGGREDSSCVLLHPLLRPPLPQRPTPAATPRRRGRSAEPIRSAVVGGSRAWLLVSPPTTSVLGR